MAGKKQHYVPQFLMRGFASKTLRIKKKNSHYAWLYRKDAEPIEVPIRDIGRQDHFYGPSGVDTADERMTDRETRIYAPLVQRIRSLQPGTVISEPSLPEFVAHLVTRSNYVRGVFDDLGALAVDEVMAVIGNPNALAPWLEQTIKDNPEFVKRQFEELLGPELGRFLCEIVPLTATPESVADIAEYFGRTGKEMASVIAPSVKRGHVDGLKQRLAPKKIVEALEFLQWFVFDTNQSVILGDFGCLLEMEENESFGPIPYDAATIKGAYLPVSSHKMVLGTRSSICPIVDEKRFNEITARLCRDFFISTEKNDNFIDLASTIGSETVLDKFGDIDEIREIIRTPPKL
jgi:hypothetical protein